MKTIYKRIFPLLTLFILYACAGEEGSNEVMSRDYLKCTKQIALSGDGSQSGTLEIVADCQWTIAGFPAWLSFSQNSGTGNATVQVTCIPNTSAAEERRATITINTGDGKVKQQVDVVQAVAEESITLNVAELIFEKSGGTKTLSISSNTSWRILGVEDWFSVSQTEGTNNADITITTTANNSEEILSAVLMVKGTIKSETLSMMQMASAVPTLVAPTFADVEKTSFKAMSSYLSATTVLEYGICYSEMNDEPTVEDGIVLSEEGGASQGVISITVTGLSTVTTYHVRAFARTAVGIGYSDVATVTTAGTVPDENDNIMPDA